MIIDHDIGGIGAFVWKTKRVKMFDSRLDAFTCCNRIESCGVFLESCIRRLKGSCQSKANHATSINDRSKEVRRIGAWIPFERFGRFQKQSFLDVMCVHCPGME